MSKDLITYCGRYCGDCFLYKGEIAALARKLMDKLCESGFDRASQGLAMHIQSFEDYEKCYRVLGAMAGLKCKKTCRNGGGVPSCKIGWCCRRKNIPGCWECQEFTSCKKLDGFKLVHSDANNENLKKLKEQGVEAFLCGDRYF